MLCIRDCTIIYFLMVAASHWLIVKHTVPNVRSSEGTVVFISKFSVQFTKMDWTRLQMFSILVFSMHTFVLRGSRLFFNGWKWSFEAHETCFSSEIFCFEIHQGHITYRMGTARKFSCSPGRGGRRSRARDCAASPQIISSKMTVLFRKRDCVLTA